MSEGVGARERRRSRTTVIPFPEDDNKALIAEMRSLVGAMSENTAVLTELSGAATGVLRFAQKWLGWAVAALAIAYPAVGKIISGLPPLPG